jgi:hypothetical protein
LTTLGPLEHEYKVFTNDPKQPVIKLTLTATVKPLPDFIKRLSSPPMAGGEQVGDFKLWPMAYPTIKAERGESLSFGIRVRPINAGPVELDLASKPSGKLDYKLRRDAGGGYWLDVEVKQVEHTGLFTESIVLRSRGTPPAEITVPVTVDVPARNLIITPASVDFGKVAASDLKNGAGRSSRVGIRKLVGTFKIKAVTAAREFFQVQIQEVVPGSNYVIRIGIDPAKVPGPGSHDGVLRVETDDREKPVIEIPYKLTVVAGAASG